MAFWIPIVAFVDTSNSAGRLVRDPLASTVRTNSIIYDEGHRTHNLGNLVCNSFLPCDVNIICAYLFHNDNYWITQ